MSLWKVIAKNEIRLKTSRFRKHRRFFFLLIFSILLFWAAYLGPIILDSILPEIFKSYSGNFDILFVSIIENAFGSLFLMYLIYPLFILFRKEKISQKEILLASPVKSGDFFLGEIFGLVPFYFLFILGIGPFFTSLLIQINTNLTIIHHLFIYLIFFTLFILGSLLGRFVAKWIEFRFITSKNLNRSRNLLLLSISISVVVLYFLSQASFQLLKANRDLRIFFPSFWYSNIILFLVKPSLIEPYLLNIWIDFGLTLFFPLLILYITYKKAKLPFKLEKGTKKSIHGSNIESMFYHTITWITPKKYTGLVITQFKTFLRKKENKMKIVYITGLIVFFGTLIFISVNDQTMSFGEILGIPIVIQIKITKELIIFVISWMGGLIFGILMGITAFFESKDILDLYKKSPSGVNRFVYSFLYLMFHHLILIGIFLSIFFAFMFQINLLIILIFFLTFIINSVTILLQSMGIQFIKPLFEERRKNLIFNNYIIFALQVISLSLTLYIFIPTISEIFTPSTILLVLLFINLGISLSFGLLLFFVGIWKLERTD
jgi:hypothetical protein